MADATLPCTAQPLLRRAAWRFCKAPGALTAREATYVDAACAVCPALATVRRLAAEFRCMLDAHDANALASWLAAAEASELRPLAASLRCD